MNKNKTKIEYLIQKKKKINKIYYVRDKTGR